MQFVREVDGGWLVNAGSVGMPYGERGAHWALLGPTIELRRTPYDLERAAERIRASAWPKAAAFAAGNVLTVPSADDALALFEQIAAVETRADELLA